MTVETTYAMQGSTTWSSWNDVGSSPSFLGVAAPGPSGLLVGGEPGVSEDAIEEELGLHRVSPRRQGLTAVPDTVQEVVNRSGEAECLRRRRPAEGLGRHLAHGRAVGPADRDPVGCGDVRARPVAVSVELLAPAAGVAGPHEHAGMTVVEPDERGHAVFLPAVLTGRVRADVDGLAPAVPA